MLRFIAHFAALLLLLAIAGCGARDPYAPIQDVTELAQDAGAYHGLPRDARLLSKDAQATAYETFLTAHFDPWARPAPKHTSEQVFWGLAAYAGKNLFGENTLPRDAGWLHRMGCASRVGAYPSMHRRGIATANTSMRVLPTNRPAFYDFTRPGEGFPFDYIQNSLVLAGTPLLATHTSADGAWILVESRFAYGWIPATEIGWVDDAFIDAFTAVPLAAVTRDDIPVSDEQGQHCFMAHIGTLLPILAANPDGPLTLGVPTRDHEGNAVLHRAKLSGSAAEQAPVPATPASFTRVANAMLNRQYGWGGLYENRDCSAMTMDLMAAFGILLPRNSSKQIKVGMQVSLEGMDRNEKKTTIIANATPFLTLVRKSGHIMLYIGSQDHNPIVMHATWGLKTETSKGYGRKVIGSTVITTLEPGLELDDLARPSGILLETVYAITTLP